MPYGYGEVIKNDDSKRLGVMLGKCKGIRPAWHIHSQCALPLSRFCSFGSPSWTCRERYSIRKKDGKTKQIHSGNFWSYTVRMQPRNRPVLGTRQLYRLGCNISKYMRRTCKVGFYIVCRIEGCFVVSDHTSSPQPFETTQIRVQRASYTVSRIYADKSAFIASVDEVDWSIILMA